MSIPTQVTRLALEFGYANPQNHLHMAKFLLGAWICMYIFKPSLPYLNSRLMTGNYRHYLYIQQLETNWRARTSVGTGHDSYVHVARMELRPISTGYSGHKGVFGTEEYFGEFFVRYSWDVCWTILGSLLGTLRIFVGYSWDLCRVLLGPYLYTPGIFVDGILFCISRSSEMFRSS